MGRNRGGEKRSGGGMVEDNRLGASDTGDTQVRRFDDEEK